MVERRQDPRYQSPETLTVVDRDTRQPVGTLVNLSNDGAMFVCDSPTKPGATLYCRLDLTRPIMGHSEVVFDAECRWCRKNIARNRWESGYRLSASNENAYLMSFLVLSYKLSESDETAIPDVRTVELTNRRRSVRFEFETPLPVFEEQDYRQIGTLADVSVDGFRIISAATVNRSDIVKYRVQLPKKIFEQEFLILTAQCRWCRKMKNGKQFESGYLFQQVAKQDAAVILHLIMHYARPQQCEKQILVVG